MPRELLDVSGDVDLSLARQLAERHDVLVGHVAEGEVHPACNEIRDMDVEARPLVFDALHPMKAALLPALAAEDLQRRIAQPGLRHNLVACARAGAGDELEQRPLPEGDRRDRAGLEVAVLANPRGVHAISRSVQVHETGVEVPAARNVFGLEPLVCARFDRAPPGRQHGRERLGLDAPPVHPVRRAVVIEARELPIAEPIDGPEQTPLLQTLWWRSVRREPLLAEGVDGREPLEDPRAIGILYELRIVVLA